MKTVEWLSLALLLVGISFIPVDVTAHVTGSNGSPDGLIVTRHFSGIWDQVDQERRTAWIHADQSRSRRAIAVPLNEDAVGVLTQQLNKHPIFVFTYKDAPVARTTTKAWKLALARAGIEDFRWHDLRHTFASRLVMGGTDIRTVQELLGHKTITMTMRYAHLSPGHKMDAVQRLANRQNQDRTSTNTDTKKKGAQALTHNPSELLVGGRRLELRTPGL